MQPDAYTDFAAAVLALPKYIDRLKEVDAREGLLEHYYRECIACDVTMCIHRSCVGALLSVIGRIFHFFL